MHRWARFGLAALSLTLAGGLSAGCGDNDELPDSGIGEPPGADGRGTTIRITLPRVEP